MFNQYKTIDLWPNYPHKSLQKINFLKVKQPNNRKSPLNEIGPYNIKLDSISH